MVYYIIGPIAALLVGAVIGFYAYKKTLTSQAIAFKAKIKKVKEIEEDIIQKAKRQADNIIQKAEQRWLKIEENAQKELDKRHEKIDKMEERILTREEKLDEQREKIEQEKQKIHDQKETIKEIKQQQQDKLSKIAGLSVDEAKKNLFEQIEQDHQKDVEQLINKYKQIAKEEAETQAQQVIARVLPRISTEHSSEFTTVSIDIPDESFKGKIIGREGRNISFFEKTTGVELIVDDTPLTVRLSSFDHEKRFLAIQTLKKLIKDTKINPHYIEKTYNEMESNMEDILLEKGKEALNILNIPMMKPAIVQNIGKFHLRYSYGQNLWNHSIEVAKICEAIATEIGIDPLMAKKAGLLHDIGKVIATTGQSHTTLGADFLKKHGTHNIIINAAASHHYDVPMTHAISWIVTAADAISAARPGARFNTKDLFIEKMGELEKLISGVKGVKKVHIMQAGREIMVYADPEAVSDTHIHGLIKTIGQKIEDQLDYPGIIRIVMFRETKVIEYIR